MLAGLSRHVGNQGWAILPNLTYIEGRFKLLGNGPLLADWFTGVLRVPRGEMLAYVHMGFGSVYEEEVHIHVERGRVTGSRIYNNRSENRFTGDRDFN